MKILFRMNITTTTRCPNAVEKKNNFFSQLFLVIKILFSIFFFYNFNVRVKKIFSNFFTFFL